MTSDRHVPVVLASLVLSTASMIFIAVPSWMDPFNNHTPWMNWLVLSIAAVAGIAVATAIAVLAGTEVDFWGALIICWFVWAAVCGFVLWVSSVSGSLTWAAYAVPLLSLPIGCMITWLANPHRRA